MLRRLDIYKWLLTAWLMLWGSVCVWAYTPNTPYTSPFESTVQSIDPSYQFRSTSAYMPAEEREMFTPLADNPNTGRSGRGPVVRKWGDPEGDEIGVIPVGDVAWGAIFLCAALYLAFRALRRKKA